MCPTEGELGPRRVAGLLRFRGIDSIAFGSGVATMARRRHDPRERPMSEQEFTDREVHPPHGFLAEGVLAAPDAPREVVWTGLA